MATVADIILSVADVASLPSDNSAATEGRLAFAESEEELYRDDGTTWVKVSTVAGSGEFSGDADDVPFTPTTPGDWTSSPTTAQDALDELAAREASSFEGDADDIPFTPTTGGDWTTSPTTVQDALDELGAREAGEGGADDDAIHDNVSGEINAITEKSTPHDNDLILIEDSEASYAKKKLKISNLPAGEGGGGGGSVVTVGTYAASRPGSPSAGDIYIPTDGIHTEVYDGTNWRPMFDGKMLTKPPTASNWTQTSLTNATLTDEYGTLLFTIDNSTSDIVSAITRPLPSAPYVVTALVEADYQHMNYMYSGISLRESSSGKLLGSGVAVVDGPSYVYRAMKWDDNSFQSEYHDPYSNFDLHRFIWFRIEDDGTDRIISTSQDGFAWRERLNVANDDFIVPDEVGFYCNYVNNEDPDLYRQYFRIHSWEIDT